MTFNLVRFWNAFIFFSILQGAVSTKKGYYTIVAPAIIRPEAIFHVSFTLSDFPKPCWFNISLTTDPEGKQIYGLEGIEVKPGTTKLVELHAPSFKTRISYANLEVFGYRGIISKDSAIIYFEAEKFWAFVQTNKAKYKPGELVQFRIICIDQLTRPAKLNEPITAEIHDDQYNLIRTIHDIKFVQGVFRSEFQLSEYPILGTWTINVLHGEKRLAVKAFEVGRYVLPKFSMKMKTQKVSIDDEEMVLEISASYLYGKPVEGNVSITVINFHAPHAKLLPTLTRESKINGKTKICLSLKKDLKLRHENITQKSYPNSIYSTPADELYKFDIEAIVTDALNEDQSRKAIEVAVYRQPYKIDIDAPRLFDPDPLLKIKVVVWINDLDDDLIYLPVTPIEVIVGCRKKTNDSDFDISRFETEKTGNDFSIIQVPNKNYSECFLYAEYEGSQSHTKWMKAKVNPFDMEILTKRPREGRELEIKMTNQHPIEEFSYEIVSRKDIIQSGHVIVPANETTYILRLNVTSSMVPKITIYAHLIKDMSFIGQLKDVPIRKAIKIITEDETGPGTDDYINFTTDEGSYVGLMGLDRDVLLGDILSDNYDVKEQLDCENSIKFYYNTTFNGRTGDIITFSNVFPPGVAGAGGGGSGSYGPPKPDLITSWAITGFLINSNTRFTFTKYIQNLKAFKKFYISMDFPSSIKEDEIIEIPVYITNYFNQKALTNVTIESNSEGLGILDEPEASSKSKQNISELIPSKNVLNYKFFNKPFKQGDYNVTVKAFCSVASYAVQKTLNVQPQGIPYAKSKTILVHLPVESKQKDEITIDIPANAVPGSQRVDVSVVGDIFQPLLRDIQNLAKIPYGNCEENMRLIVSNSIVLKYLKVLNYSYPSLESKIKRNIDLGYQNQLSFKYLDGSFGLFERKNERTGDIWQTIFSLWGLEQANEFVRIDPGIIDRGLEYLKSKQERNGCLKSGSNIEEDAKFTAFGLMAFLMNEPSRTKYNEVINKGLAFLYNITDDLEYSPIAVMSIYSLILGKHEKAGDRLKKLTSNSPLTNKQMLWTKSDTLQSHLVALAGNLLSLFESEKIPEQSILYIVRGLIVSKTDESSITHLIALQAMIAFVEKLLLSKSNLDISFSDDQNRTGNFQINADNSKVIQTFEISQSSRKINVRSKGHGFAVVDVRFNYNLVPENQSSSLYTTSISTKTTSRHFRVLKICSSVPANNPQNKLTIMEVNLQSGYIFTEKASPDVENLSGDIKSVQVNGNRDKVVVYFELIINDVCLELDVRKTYNVTNSKPGWIILYDAHDKDQKVTKSFRFNDLQ